MALSLNSTAKSLSPYLDLVADMVIKGRNRSEELSSYDPSHIIIELSKKDIDHCLCSSLNWQVAFADYIGVIDNHYSHNPIIQLIKRTQWILPKIT